MSIGCPIVEVPRTRVLATRYLPGKVAINNSQFLVPKTVDVADMLADLDQMLAEQKRAFARTAFQELKRAFSDPATQPSREAIAQYVATHPELANGLDDRETLFEVVMGESVQNLRAIAQSSVTTNASSTSKPSSQPSAKPSGETEGTVDVVPAAAQYPKDRAQRISTPSPSPKSATSASTTSPSGNPANSSKTPADSVGSKSTTPTRAR